MSEVLLEIAGWYVSLSFSLGLWYAVLNWWDYNGHRFVSGKRRPQINKEDLGYAIAFIIACPLLNVAAVVAALLDRRLPR